MLSLEAISFLCFNWWLVALRPTRRLRLEFVHGLGDGTFELRIMSVHHRLGIILHFDVRIDAVPLDNPLAFRIGKTKLRNVHNASIDQGAAIGDSDHAAPRTFSD